MGVAVLSTSFAALRTLLPSQDNSCKQVTFLFANETHNHVALRLDTHVLLIHEMKACMLCERSGPKLAVQASRRYRHEHKISLHYCRLLYICCNAHF